MFHLIPSTIISPISLWKLQLIGFSNILSKPNLKTYVQAPEYIGARLISSSFLDWRKEPSEKTLNSLLFFYVSNSEVNSRSIDFKVFYISKQQFIKSVYKSCKILLVFSVTPFKVAQKKKSKPFNRISPESGKRKKVAIFLIEDMRRNVFPKFIDIFLWRRHAGTHAISPRWVPTWRPETSGNICH